MTRRALQATALALAAMLTIGTSPASAETGDPGLWYYDKFGVAEAHAAGYTGQGVQIAVIEYGQINVSVPELQGVNLTVHEPSYCEAGLRDQTPLPATSTVSGRHATSMVSYLLSTGTGVGGQQAPIGVAPGASVRFYSFGAAYGVGTASEFTDCIREGKTSSDLHPPLDLAIKQAINDGADIISLSVAGSTSEEIEVAFIEGIRKGVIFVAGRSNDTLRELATISALNGAITVQAMNSDGEIIDAHKIDDIEIDVVGPGIGLKSIWDDFQVYSTADGSSGATAITAGFLSIVESKYPEATNNQIIQSLIHNTGFEDHELTFDENLFYGYGTVSLTHMLRVDPMQYEDVNPLILTEFDQHRINYAPTYEEIFPEKAVSTPDLPVAEPTRQSIPPATVGMLFVGGLATLVIATVTVIVVVVRSKRRT